MKVFFVRILSNDNRGEGKPLSNPRVDAQGLLDATLDATLLTTFACLRFQEPSLPEQLSSKPPSDDCLRESACAGD